TSALPLGDGAVRSELSGFYDVVCQPKFALRPERSASPTVACRRVRSASTTARLRRDNPPCTRAEKLERETGFEPATSTLARSHSTTELFPPLAKIQRTTPIFR